MRNSRPKIFGAWLVLPCLLLGWSMPLAAQEAETDAAAAEFSAAGVKKFRKEQKRPVLMGTSAGNAEDFEIDPPFITCGSGTAGALLEMDGRYFVASNNHVLAMSNRGKKGDEIVQPGLIDSDCDAEPDAAIATLSSYKKIRFGGVKKNSVDLAIAEIVPGTVRTNGKILRLGVPGSGTAEAFAGMPVMKAGRTSGFTRGDVAAIGVDGTVDFEVVTSEGASQTREALFVNVIVVQDRNKAFSAGGDSGSMVYVDEKPCPRAVGLLFAGAGEITAVNPIQEVLKVARNLKPKGEKTLVGCDREPEPFAALSAREEREVQAALRVKKRASEWVREIEGVVAIGVGRDEQARPVVQIFVERATDDLLAQLPTELEGVATKVVESGRFKAF